MNPTPPHSARPVSVRKALIALAVFLALFVSLGLIAIRTGHTRPETPLEWIVVCVVGYLSIKLLLEGYLAPGLRTLWRKTADSSSQDEPKS